MKNCILQEFFHLKTKNRDFWGILRLNTFLSLLLLSSICSGNLFSQNTKITLKQTNVQLEKILTEIEQKTDYLFVYNDEIDAKKTVSINVSSLSVEEVLKDLFKNSNISYKIQNKHIILSPQQKTKTTNKELKKRTITGTVTETNNNEPIIGATVWLKNTSIGATTDLDGHYSIVTESIGGVLEFSYIGMAKQEIAIADRLVINVKLEEDTEKLDEVVVVGYGVQKKESVVGAISTVNVANLKVPGSSVSNVLAGQLAGVVSMTRSGEPGKGSASNFYIRGVSSFKGGSRPLVLVDGIERDLDLVSTEDIASFSILKDASASAVYGVRGANGVIIITTKKGTEGKPKINVRTEYGITSPTRFPKMLGSAQWAQLYNEAAGTNYYNEEAISKYIDGSDSDLYPNVNWQKTMFKEFANNQRANINVSGGGDIVKYYISGAFYNESSIFKAAKDVYGYNSSINYNKFNFRSNIDISLTKSTTLNVNLANIYENKFSPSGMGDGWDEGELWSYTIVTSPNAFPREYSDGTISAPSSDSGYNPWNLLVHSGYREQFWNSSQALIGLTQDFGGIAEPLKGLTANFKFSWDAWNTSTQRRHKEPTQYHATGRDEDDNLIFGNPIRTGSGELAYARRTNGTKTSYMEASLNYNRLFADQHRLGALFLYNHKIHNRTQEGDKFKSLPYKNQGVAGRLTYAFKDTYLAEFNIGYNGSENFAPGHRFGIFPAGAIGWVVSNESWFEPAKSFVDAFKIRASHGKVGNDDIGGQRRWVYESSIVSSGNDNTYYYGASGQSIGSGTGIRIGDVENLNASWEEALKTNIGIELSFFNKLRVQADFFREDRKGIFLQRAGLPALAGLSTTPYTNIGRAFNAGFDGTIEYDQKIGDLFVTARGNFSYNKNKLIDNDEPDWKYKYQNRIGKPFGTGGYTQPFGLKAIGLFKTEEEIENSPTQMFGEYRIGDIKYQDINGDGKIDQQDQVAIGYTNLPEIIFGFGATAQWKGWDFNLFFQGVGHTSFMLGGYSVRSLFSSGNLERAGVNEDVYNKVWKSSNTEQENENAIYPRLSLGGQAGSSNNEQSSSWWVRNSSFVRLKNFEMGYTLPKSLINKTFVNTLRFYVSGNNLLTFSEFKLWDPERGNGDGNGYPPNRVIMLGFNANF